MSTSVSMLRVRHWYKNFLLFAALLSAKPTMADLGLASAGFMVFCALSSGNYVLNDIVDREKDLHHPVKSKRAIAAGKIGKSAAIATCILLLISGIAAAASLSYAFLIISIMFVCNSAAYTFLLKRIPFVETASLVGNNLLRVIASSALIGTKLSIWLLLAVAMAAGALVFWKRLYELMLLKKRAMLHRPVLSFYSEHMLIRLMAISGLALLVFYGIYTVDEKCLWLQISIPFLAIMILRLLHLVNANPTLPDPAAISKDRTIFISLAASCMAVIMQIML